jgi:hypothetical protein
VLARLLYSRLRNLMLKDARRAWNEDLAAATARVEGTLTELRGELAALRRAQGPLLVAELDRRQASMLNDVRARLDATRIATHLARAIANAELRTTPMPHMVVDQLLPPDVYDLLVRTIPPTEVFGDHDPVKQDFEMSALDSAPAVTSLVWRFFDEQVVGTVITTAILRRFAPFVSDHYAQTGGGPFGAQAAAIPHRSFAGRIQLRRPGYALRPHLDPKRVVVTGLVYFARPGDSEAYGTQLYSIDRPFVQAGLKTFYPEHHGMTCTLAASVPFTANTMLAFVNSGGAHGASLPLDASLKERYAYQFYVKPDDGLLKGLLGTLPEEARAPWADLFSPKTAAATPP